MGDSSSSRRVTRAVSLQMTTGQRWREALLGYSTLATGDHIFFGGWAPIPALMAAADATTTLRLATHVLANDFRNPVMLAQEVATLDVLSEGRLEFGIGAGWLALDYAATGIPFDPPVTRVKRLEETVHLLKRLFGDEPVAFTGDYYTIQDMNLQTKPLQRPPSPFIHWWRGQAGVDTGRSGGEHRRA